MQWNPDRLKADTLFVMGSKANKSVASLYYLHIHGASFIYRLD